MLWDNSKFNVNSEEVGVGWIVLYGLNMISGFECAVVGLYAPNIVHHRKKLCMDLITLKFAFDVPLFLMGDFYETLLPEERSIGYINHVECRDLKKFLAICNLMEYPLSGHRFTWFRGGSMNRIDRSFSSPDCHLQFNDLMSRRLPDHRQLLLGYQEQIKGWKPFRFLDCWLTHPQFMPQIESRWDSDCKQFPGR
jgi:hypothetical protein